MVILQKTLEKFSANFDVELIKTSCFFTADDIKFNEKMCYHIDLRNMGPITLNNQKYIFKMADEVAARIRMKPNPGDVIVSKMAHFLSVSSRFSVVVFC